MRRACAAIAAAAEATFPENDLGAPDWKSADLVNRTLAYLDILPPATRRLIVALFVLLELCAPILVPATSRFSKLSVDRRLEAIRRWRKSSFYPMRLVGDSIKGVLTMMYMSDAAVLRFIGMYKGCSNAADPLQVEVRRPELVKIGAKPPAEV